MPHGIHAYVPALAPFLCCFQHLKYFHNRLGGRGPIPTVLGGSHLYAHACYQDAHIPVQPHLYST